MMKTTSEVQVTERFLSEVWRRQLLNKESLVTAEGRKLRVVDPGRWNSDSGPDFRGAALVLDEGDIMRGDIEIHVRARDWRCHGHHRDRNYDGVVLHVVMWESACSFLDLLGGERRVEMLPLHRCLAKPLGELQRMIQQEALLAKPCAAALEKLGEEAVGRMLDGAGERRFLLKATQFEQELVSRKPKEVLYEGLMVALGYAKNKDPFRELARRLPLSMLEGRSQEARRQDCALLIQGLLLGGAGMLPTQRGIPVLESWEGLLEEVWGRFGCWEGMAQGDWRFFKVRPENLPVRRLAGASYLLARYGRQGLLGGLLRLVEGADSFRPADMERGLMVSAQGCWCNHRDFGIPLRRGPALIGQGRAREMVINVLLPFCYAWAKAAGSPRLKDHAWEFYRRYPRQEDNWITRYMESQVFHKRCPGMVNSACRQQGLIHLHREFCSRLRCNECPLG